MAKHFIYETQQFQRVQYLKDILGRLEAEVGTVLKCFEEYNAQAEHKTGFWSGIRLLMPVIESVATAMEKAPWELLEDNLAVKAGNLTWQMFRHSLTHGDLLRCAKYGTQSVGWGVMMLRKDHNIKDGRIWLDLFTLYDKLVGYLKSEIAKDDKTVIEVKVGINYTNPPQYIIDDFNKIK